MNHREIQLTNDELYYERWKPIPGYEGIYEASNMGRVRTMEGKVTYSERSGRRVWEQRVLKPKGITPRTGYRVSLYKEKQCKDFLVARLVAMTWLNGYEQSMTVNHINGNRLDNRIINLEWVTIGENLKHANEFGLTNFNRVKITLHGPEGEEMTFNSMKDASVYLGKSQKYVSGMLAKGKKTTPEGYVIDVAQ